MFKQKRDKKPFRLGHLGAAEGEAVDAGEGLPDNPALIAILAGVFLGVLAGSSVLIITASAAWTALAFFIVAPPSAITVYGRSTKRKVWVLALYALLGANETGKRILVAYVRWSRSHLAYQLLGLLILFSLQALLFLSFEDTGKSIAAQFGIETSWLTTSKGLLLLVLVTPLFGAATKKLGEWFETKDLDSFDQLRNHILGGPNELGHTVVKCLSGNLDDESKALGVLHASIDYLQTFFTAVTGQLDMRSCLYTVKDGEIVELLYLTPHRAHQRTHIDTLRDRRSGASRCIRERRLKVISNIPREVAKGPDSEYIKCPKGEDSARGGTLCYPFRSTDGSIVYVACIKTDTAGAFKEDQRELYEMQFQIAEAFVLLAHCLAKSV